MKIAVPVMNDDGLKSIISEHFGHAPFFAFVEVEDGKIKDVELERNPFEEHTPGQITQYLHEKGTNVLIARGMGGRAKDFFAQLGVKTITGAAGEIDEIINTFIKGSLNSSDYEPEDKHLYHHE